jgi:hypothetical protein
VSAQTVRNRLHEGGMRARRPQVGVVLTPCRTFGIYQKTQRLANSPLAPCALHRWKQVHTEHVTDVTESVKIAVLWKLNLIKSHCQISGLGCAQSIPLWANCAVKTLMPFATTYLCESGFSALTSMKTKHRHRLCVENDLTLRLSNRTQHCRVMFILSSTPFSLTYGELFTIFDEQIRFYM